MSSGYGMHGIQQVIVARDGRLVAATDEGVWRTRGPVYAVAEESGPEPVGGLAVSPNPSGDTVTVRLGGAVKGTVSVYDVRGRVVWSAVVERGAETVEVSGLAAGVYHVRTEAGAVGRFTVAR